VSLSASPIRIPVTASSPVNVFIVAARSGLNSSSAACTRARTSASEYRYGVARRGPAGPWLAGGTATGRPDAAR